MSDPVTLNLAGADLTSVPEEVLRMSRLQVLDLGRNRLTSLPPELGDLSDLRVLNLSDNQLMFLPEALGRLPRLSTLDLGRNQLTNVPPALGRLRGLEVLNLWGCRLRTLPAEIGDLCRLRTLNLGDNQLSELPPGIGRLASLVSLDLGNNQLVELPSEIGGLSLLETLALWGNQLVGLPPEIGDLIRLDTLGLSHNRLTSLPEEIGNLASLRVLRAGNNRLTSLPAAMGRLSELQVLYLGDTREEELSTRVTRIAGSQRAGLTQNRLTSLPAEIGALPKLRVLNVSDNQLTALPSELAPALSRGMTLVADGNPWPEPYPEMLARGPAALASYLSSLADAVALYEAKLLLVGEGNVGKTCLVAALCGEQFVNGRSTTHGIEIRPLVLPHPTSGTAMTVRAWDFGGQEVYRITHQFFFSARAVYLVVWKPREGQEQNEVEGWLRRIRLRVGCGARALVVATHCEERWPELGYPQLRRAFPELVGGNHAVDNRSGRGIDDLRLAIAEEVSRLPQMGQRLSRRWISVRDEIQAIADAEPQIPYQRYVEACERHQVTGEEITTLINLLHDLGQVIYYGDDEGLRDIVVLNPEWLTKAISYVLEDRPTREAGGVLDHGRLRDIWSRCPGGGGYPQRHHPYFLRLMEKFDVSYRLADDTEHSLVAQLVPREEPDLPWDVDTPIPRGIRAITLICGLSEPAPGLIAWLTVRHHAATTGRHWVSGVFLRHPIGAYDSEALLRAGQDGEVVLQVRAPSPDLFFNVLRDSLERLVRTRWPGLTYKLLIPCPTRTEDDGPCEGRFPLDGLLRFRESGGGVYPCLECQRTHDVSELVTGFAASEDTTGGQISDLRGDVRRLRDEVRSGTDTVLDQVRESQRTVASAAAAIRRVVKALSSEVTDCPRLFTMVEEPPVGWERLLPFQRHYRITLWCEHPDHWHPVPEADYRMHLPRQWVATVAPYATLVLRTLRLAAPIAGGVAGAALSDTEFGRHAGQLKVAQALVDSLPEEVGAGQPGLADDSVHLPSALGPAEGEGLRRFRTSLFQLDPGRGFGDLRRVIAPSGEYLWVCPTHYRAYDPGLPRLSHPLGPEAQGASETSGPASQAVFR